MAPPHLESCSNNEGEEEETEEEEEDEEEDEEDEESLCARLIKYIHKAYPDAFAFVGRNESQHVDGILKGWQSGILVMRGTPDGFTNVFPVSLDQSYESVVIALHEHYKEAFKKGSAPVENEEEEEEWYDFSTNSNPKYWLRMFSKTALMRECDKRGVIIDNPMMTLNVRIIEALIAADTV
jgi:hypothetical protein